MVHRCGSGAEAGQYGRAGRGGWGSRDCGVGSRDGQPPSGTSCIAVGNRANASLWSTIVTALLVHLLRFGCLSRRQQSCEETSGMLEVERTAGIVEYEDTGGQGPALVFLPGLTMDGSLWRRVVSARRSSSRSATPGAPGAWSSPPAKPHPRGSARAAHPRHPGLCSRQLVIIVPMLTAAVATRTTVARDVP